jgi:ketosteroid isomerase-like protein
MTRSGTPPATPSLSRRIPAVIGVVTVLLAGGCAAPPPVGPGGASSPPDRARLEAEVRDFSLALCAAYGANDLEKYWPFFDDRMTMFTPEGRLDLPDFKRTWTREIGSGTRVTLSRCDDHVVHLGPNGDAAVVHYRIVTRTEFPDGRTVDEVSQESDGLALRDGRWRVVHVHWSHAPGGAPATGSHPGV